MIYSLYTPDFIYLRMAIHIREVTELEASCQLAACGSPAKDMPKLTASPTVSAFAPLAIVTHLFGIIKSTTPKDLGQCPGHLL